MKNIFNYSMTALCLAMLAVSCQKNPELTAPKEKTTEEKSNLVTLTCAFPTLDNENGTKVTLADDGKTAWEADVDQIVFQGFPRDAGNNYITPITHTFTSAELANPEVASFSVDLSSLRPDSEDGTLNHDYNVAYPASIWSSYSSSHMYGRSSFSNTNKMLMAGYVDGSRIVLHHMTAAIVFTVAGDIYDSYTFEGNGDDAIVGYSKLVVETNKPNVTSYRKKYLTSSSGTSGPLTKISGNLVSDGSTINTIFLPVNTKRSGSSEPYEYDGVNENEANYIHLPNGFTIKLLQGGVIKKYITSDVPLDIQPGHMINLGEIPIAAFHDFVASAHNSTVSPVPADGSDKNLSKTASANCYIVSGEKETPATDTGDYVNAGNIYKFRAYKGKSSTDVGTIQSVGILWETYNNATTPTKNTVIAAVDYDKQAEKEYYDIVFQMPAQANFHRGNAVIAAYDGPYDGEGKPTGNIVWSWHIWVPNNNVVSGNVTDATIFGSKPIMDRNLGAIVPAPADAAATVESYGLLYQWGRKDPFPGNKGVTTNGAAAVSGVAMTSQDGTLTIDASIKNPTVFARSAEGKDWVTPSENDNTLWNTTKTIYDPCPPGYIVPTRNTSVHYWSGTALNSLDASDHFADNGATYYSYVIGTGTLVVFPYAGYIQMGYGDQYKAGNRAYVWSSYASSYNDNVDIAYLMYTARDGDSDGPTYQRKERGKCLGASVRCVAE